MARKSRKNIIQETNVPKIYKTAVYARYSVENDRAKEIGSLENQIKFVKNYVLAQDDMELVGVYVDDDYSGTNFNRPDFIQLMADIKRGKVNAVVFKDLSRLGRNYVETSNLIENVFPELKVRIVAIGNGFDSLYDDPGIMIAVINLFNDLTARDCSKKVSAVKKMQVEKGVPASRVAYGYKKVRNENGEFSMIIDEAVADNVRLIYKLFISGMKMREIAKYLNEHEIITVSKHNNYKYKTPEWNVHSVKRVLTSDVYTGIYKTGKTERSLYKGQHITYIDSANWFVFENHHPAIISTEDFAKAAEIIKANAYGTARKTKNIQPLRGKVFCGKCGHTVRPTKNFYRCGWKNSYNSDVCNCDDIGYETLNNLVFKVIKERALSVIDEAEMLKTLKTSSAPAIKRRELKQALAHKQSELNKVHQSKRDLYADFAEGLLTEDDYIAINKNYTAKMKDIEAVINELSGEIYCLEADSLNDEYLLSIVNSVKNKRKLTRELVEIFVDRITVYSAAEIEVRLKFDDTLEELISAREKREAIING